MTGYVLTPWQAETVLEASKQYNLQFSNKKASAPWGGFGVDKNKAASAIKQALRIKR